MERIARGWKVATGGGVIMTVLAQTKPEEAISNIAAWAKLAGVSDLPTFLSTPSFDLWVTIAGIATVLVSLIMWRRQVVIRHVHHKELMVETKPIASIDTVVTRAPKSKGAADYAQDMLREQRREQLELAHRLNKFDAQDRERKRKLIDDCRETVADYDGDIGQLSQRRALEKTPAYLALRQHLTQRFLDFVANKTLTIDPKNPGPLMIRSFADELDRLEKEWGLS